MDMIFWCEIVESFQMYIFNLSLFNKHYSMLFSSVACWQVHAVTLNPKKE